MGVEQYQIDIKDNISISLYSILGSTSILFWLISGIIIQGYFKGRRTKMLVILLGLCIVSESIQLTLAYIHKGNNSSPESNETEEDIFLVITGSITYCLYYQICLLSSCDIAKIERLRSNIKHLGMLYCVMNGIQYFA